MVQNSASVSNPDDKGSSALECEADRVDNLMKGGKGEKAPQETEDGANGLNNPTQVGQDLRIAKGIADAKAAGGGPDQPEAGLNQDG